jgi:glycosyltransferase involved in cell wall biosynthesis
MLAPDSADTPNALEDSRVNDLCVVVPVRNAEDIIEDCLASITRACPRQVIVVDGMSSDRTLEVVRRYPVTILSDEGAGLPAARLLGARTATTRHVALIDADVVLHDGALEQLLAEFLDGGYTALQAGLHSVSGDGYWGRALAHHHRSGRSKDWFGLVATIFERDVLLRHGFDERFKSGEDIDLRWRLQAAGAKLGVSRRTVVQHRFGDTWEFAKGQWLADGHGLGRMVAAHGLRAKLLLGLPLAAFLRGSALSLVRRQPRWIPYYLCYVAFNYAGMFRELRRRMFRRRAPAVASAEA